MNKKNRISDIRLAPLHQQILKGIVFSLPFLFLLLFLFYPLTAILIHSFDHPPMIPSWHSILRIVSFTLGQAMLSTILTLLLGLPGAHVMARYRFWGQSWLHALTTIPFVMPTLVVAAAFLTLIGPNGALNNLLPRIGLSPLPLQHTLSIILIAHVFYNYSVVLRVVGSVWANLDPRQEEAARTLGADRWRAWWEITLPQLTPAIAAAALLILMFCFTSLGVVMILGGPRFATIEVEIYRQAAHLLNLPVAAALSLGQMVLTFGLMSAYTALQRRAARPLELRSRQSIQQKPRTWKARAWIGLNVAVMVVLLITPLSALIWRSLTLDPTQPFRYYVALTRDPGRSYFFTPPLIAIRNSLTFAISTVGMSLLLGTLGAYLLASRDKPFKQLAIWLDPLLMLPLGTSAITLGLGYILAFNRPPLNLIRSPLLIPAAHTLIAFPFVLRSMLPALRSLRPTLREAAATLGASPWRVWLAVDLPLLTRPLLVGATYAMTISLGEFGATLLLARREYATIPVAIYRYLSNPGPANLGQALAMSVLLMAVCAASFLVIERFQTEAGEF